MACTKLMSAPVCFIDTDENGKLFVRKEAKEILDSIRDPVVVVSVVGLYRTGKSYLMNRLAGQQSGFPLGSTIESKTKGIWMWCLSHPTKAGHTLVLLDTEGLGDVDKGDEKHDTWIFCLALLLSSTLVYNSLGVIDNMALEKLHYVTELREHIRVKSGASNEDDTADFMSVFPAFVWAVRDFTLELIKDDQPITSDEYLESGLTLKTGNSAQIEHFNLPRLCLRNFFAVRKCFVFPRPAGTKEMRRMETLTEAELDEEFLQQAETFCQYIYSSAQPKKISEGRAVTGTVLGNLAEVYVEAIRSGNVPCLENAVVSLAQIHNLRALEEALQLYMTEMFSSIQIPVDPKQLSDIHENAEKKAVEIFFSMCFNDTSQIDLSLDLMEKIQEEYEDLCQQNRELSVKQCQSVLNRVFEPFEKAVRNGSYVYPGGYREYREMFTLLAEEYRSQTRTQTQKVSEEVFNKYWKEKEEHGMVILAADESLTAAEKEKEVTRQNNNILKQKTWSLEKQNQLQMQMLQDQQRTHDEHVKQLTEKMEKEQERWRKDQEQVMEAKLQEKIQEEYEDLCQQNRELSVKQCQSVLNRVFEPFEKAVRNGSYVYPGGYREYREMFTLLAEEYRSQTRTQTQKVSEEVFDKYCKEKEESGMIILAADESLTAAEQEKEVTRQKNNILKKETGSLGKWNLLQMQMLQNLQRNHDEHVKQLTEKMEKEQEKRRKDQERLMEAKLKIDEVLSKYQEEMEESGMIILAADESLTAAEQEKKGEKLKTDILEQKQRILEEQDQPQQRMLEDKQRTHEEHVKQLTDKMEKEQERWRRDQEQVLEAKLREKEALLQEGFYQQTASMQRKIHRLEEEMRTKREKPTFHGLATLASLLSLIMFNRN